MVLDLQQYIQSVLLPPHKTLPVNPLKSELLSFQIVIHLKLGNGLLVLSDLFHTILLIKLACGYYLSLFLVLVFQNSSQLPYSQFNTCANPHFHPHRKKHSLEDNVVLHLLNTNITVYSLNGGSPLQIQMSSNR